MLAVDVACPLSLAVAWEPSRVDEVTRGPPDI
jgi:hypothetical protein